MKKLLSMVLGAVMLFCALNSALAETNNTAYKGVKLTVMDKDNAVLPFDVNSLSTQAIQENTGVELDFMLVADTDFETKVNTLLAANNMPDICRVTYGQVNNYARDGMFVNLSEYIEAGKLPNYAKMLETMGDKMDYYKVDGEIYTFQQVWEVGLPNGAVPYIRGDVVEKLGLKMPTTFDELYEVLKAIKAWDPESNIWVTRWANLQIDYSYGVGGFYYNPETDSYICGYLDNEKYMDYLAFCNKLYAEGLIDPDFLTTTSADWQEACKNGSCYFTYNNCVFVNQFNMALQAEDPDAYWTPMYTLENPWGRRRGRWSVGVGYNEPTNLGYAISADCENVDAALYLLDYMYSDEGREITNWGFEGITFGIDDNGEYYMLPEFCDAVRNGDITMQSHLSGADLGFCLVIDDWANRAVNLDDAGRELYEFWLSDEHMDTAKPTPPFTDDEKERLTEVNSRIEVIVGDINAFIVGTRDISEWPTVAAEIEKAGAQECIDIHNRALARMRAE